MAIQFNSSLSSTGRITAPSFTGSLFGTASHVKVSGSGITVNWDRDTLQLTSSASPVQNASQVFISQSSPGLQPSGALWWNTDDGNLYVQTEGPSGSSFVAATNTIVGAAGNAISASYATTAGTANNTVSSSYSTTASHLIGYQPVVLSAGPGISIDGYKISASVLTVNGSSPDANGNIATALTEAITGPSASLVLSSSGNITSSLTEGTVWVISGETTPNEALNGVSYIYDVQNGVGEWLKLSSLDQVTADNRYLMLTPQSPLAGPLETTWGITGSLLGTASFAQNSLSASYFLTSSVTSASFAQTASVARLAATASVAGAALTASFALTVAPKSAFLWAAPMGTPSVIGGNIFGTATYLNANQGVRLTQAVTGQFGTVNFNASTFDFTKDFRVSIATFAGTVTSPAVTGDGVWIGIGGNATNIARQGQNQAFSWWSSTYPGTPGQYIYYNGNTLISDTGELGLTNAWGTNVLESRTNTLGTRTITGIVNGNYRISYTGTEPFGGTWISIGASTGGAWAEHYVRYICVEYI
jgi:hypothetical protein